MSSLDSVQVMVLAAGLGTRLWPLTADRAKPAVPFLGQPLIRTQVQRLLSHGLKHIVVNTHHKAESIASALKGLPVQLSHEDEILGTAGCLAHARDRRLLDPGKHTLIVNGKLFTHFDFKSIAEQHLDSSCPISMVLKANPHKEHFREVLVEEDRVVGFGEGRIPKGDHPWLFTGIHLVSPEVLSKTQPRFSDTINDIYPNYIDQRQIGALYSPDTWKEFSTLERYWSLHQEEFASSNSTRSLIDPSCEIEDSAQVEASVLWAGVKVGAGAVIRGAVIGEGVKILPGQVVEDTVVVRADLAENPPTGQGVGEQWWVSLDQ